MTGGPFGDICEKSLTKPKKLHKKFWSRAGLEAMSFCLADLKKAVTSMPSGSEVVWQFSVSRLTSKIYKICQFVGLKKKEVTTIVCVFLRKAPTKNQRGALE